MSINNVNKNYTNLVKGEGEKLRTTFEKELLPGLKNMANQFGLK